MQCCTPAPAMPKLSFRNRRIFSQVKKNCGVEISTTISFRTGEDTQLYYILILYSFLFYQQTTFYLDVWITVTDNRNKWAGFPRSVIMDVFVVLVCSNLIWIRLEFKCSDLSGFKEEKCAISAWVVPVEELQCKIGSLIKMNLKKKRLQVFVHISTCYTYKCVCALRLIYTAQRAFVIYII